MRVARWIIKASRAHMHTATHPGTHTRVREHAHTGKYVILLFHSNNGFTDAPQCYVIRTLPVLHITVLFDAPFSPTFSLSLGR